MHHAIVVTDLSFGDAGKGSVTDALVRRGAGLVVRFNGGAQAAHTVMDEAGRCHIFHQFGSGTLVEGTETFLSRFMLVNPLALVNEAEQLRTIGVDDAFGRMHIDARALVTTPAHVIGNRLRELARGAEKHGSCGMGIGETAAAAMAHPDRVLRFGDLANPRVLRQKLAWHRDRARRELDDLTPQLNRLPPEKVAPLLDQLHCKDELEAANEVFAFVAEQVAVEANGARFLAGRLTRPGCTLFEGAQGVLLDEEWGFHPHTTWSKTTSANALTLIGEAGPDIRTTVLGLTRAYATRHGTGPFPTEDGALTRALHEPHNPTNDWQGPFRAGWLDLAFLRYAIRANGGVDGLVMTCVDRLGEMGEPKIGIGYALDSRAWQPTSSPAPLSQREADGHALRAVKVSYAPIDPEPTNYALTVSRTLGVPLLGTSTGASAVDKTFEF